MDSDKTDKQLAILMEQGKFIVKIQHEHSLEIKEITKELKKLNAFKFQVIGAAAVMVFLIEIAKAAGR